MVKLWLGITHKKKKKIYQKSLKFRKERQGKKTRMIKKKMLT